jgi:hypothetical protein
MLLKLSLILASINAALCLALDKPVLNVQTGADSINNFETVLMCYHSPDGCNVNENRIA